MLTPPDPGKRGWLVLAVIVLSSGTVAYFMLTRGHNWGDDFAAYIFQAEAIISGRMQEFLQRSTFTIEASSWRFGPSVVPWGFPLLIAPSVALFGIRLLAIKLVLTLCYMAFLVVFFLLSRTRLTYLESLLLTAFLAFNVSLLDAQNSILSDIPFLLWSTLALLLVELLPRSRAQASPSSAHLVGIGLAIFLAAFTRANGFLLIVPLASAQWIRLRAQGREQLRSWPRMRQLLLPYVVFACCYAVQAWMLPGSTVGLREQWQPLSWLTICQNLVYYALLPGEFLEQSMRGGYVLYAVLLAGLAAAVGRRSVHDAPMLMYGLLTLGLFILFPYTQGPRYIYPILPIFFLLALEGMKEIASRLPHQTQRAALAGIRVFWASLALASLLISLRAAWENIALDQQESEGPYTAAASPLFSFVRNATPADSVVVFFKPRAMRLLTDRDSFLATQCEDLANADYVAVAKEESVYNQIPLSEIEACAGDISLTRVFGQGSFVVFQISPQPSASP